MFLGLFTWNAWTAPVKQLANFTLTDQATISRAYEFPRKKITFMTVADKKGSDQLTPWIQKIHDRYKERIDIDGIADVSMIPGPFHGMFRSAFRKELTRSVLLDWEGRVVKQFAYKKGVTNVYVIDREGRILKHLNGPISDAGLREIVLEIDRVLDGA